MVDIRSHRLSVAVLLAGCASTFAFAQQSSFVERVDVARVLIDVRDGNISPEAAECDYGVVLRRDGADWTLDQEATDAKRATLKANKR